MEKEGPCQECENGRVGMATFIFFVLCVEDNS